MSDLEVVSALDAMEQLLLGDFMEPELIIAWRQRFDAAVATAERGAGWPGIAARARELSGRLDTATKILSAQRDELRKELDLQAQGTRALKGYKPS